MKPRRLGYKPDALDPRDFNATLKLAKVALPSRASLREYVVEVLDQGNLGSCTANAVMQAIRMSQTRKGGQPKGFRTELGSRLWAYYLARAQHHETNVDEGTYIRLVFKAIKELGFPPESAWPYSDSDGRWSRMPNGAAFRAAFDMRQMSYHKIMLAGDARLDAIRTAHAAGYPVVFGTNVSTAFCADLLGEGPLRPPIGEPVAGGHAMVSVGFDGDVFDVLNSWTDQWGLGGYCTFSSEYMAWSDTNDLWIVDLG